MYPLPRNFADANYIDLSCQCYDSESSSENLAERETRTLKVYEAFPETDPRHIPIDEYGFDELYCDERGCDCRRVMINVLARHARQHVATINHAFDKPARDDLLEDQTFLDPLNRQSIWAPRLLDLFVNVVLADKEYRLRLIRHYQIFKNAINDAAHPARRIIQPPPPGSSSRPDAIRPPPPRQGKRKKWR